MDNPSRRHSNQPNSANRLCKRFRRVQANQVSRSPRLVPGEGCYPERYEQRSEERSWLGANGLPSTSNGCRVELALTQRFDLDSVTSGRQTSFFSVPHPQCRFPSYDHWDCTPTSASAAGSSEYWITGGGRSSISNDYRAETFIECEGFPGAHSTLQLNMS